MQLASILDQYLDALLSQYAGQLLPSHLNAIDAIGRCRTPEAGELFVRCSGCDHAMWRPHSCGHRSCPQCQNHAASLWWDRQQAKLLPVEYFRVTFTLSYELRQLAWHHPIHVYNLLFDCAASTLKDFGLNPNHLGAEIGMTAVLHTQTLRWIITRTSMSSCQVAASIGRENNGKRKKANTCSMRSLWQRCFAPGSWRP